MPRSGNRNIVKKRITHYSKIRFQMEAVKAAGFVVYMECVCAPPPEYCFVVFIGLQHFNCVLVSNSKHLSLIYLMDPCRNREEMCLHACPNEVETLSRRFTLPCRSGRICCTCCGRNALTRFSSLEFQHTSWWGPRWFVLVLERRQITVVPGPELHDVTRIITTSFPLCNNSSVSSKGVFQSWAQLLFTGAVGGGVYNPNWLNIQYNLYCVYHL